MVHLIHECEKYAVYDINLSTTTMKNVEKAKTKRLGRERENGCRKMETAAFVRHTKLTRSKMQNRCQKITAKSHAHR